MTKTEELRENIRDTLGRFGIGYKISRLDTAILKACKESGLEFVRQTAAEYKDNELWRPVEPIEVK